MVQRLPWACPGAGLGTSQSDCVRLVRFELFPEPLDSCFSGAFGISELSRFLFGLGRALTFLFLHTRRFSYCRGPTLFKSKRDMGRTWTHHVGDNRCLRHLVRSGRMSGVDCVQECHIPFRVAPGAIEKPSAQRHATITFIPHLMYFGTCFKIVSKLFICFYPE